MHSHPVKIPLHRIVSNWKQTESTNFLELRFTTALPNSADDKFMIFF